MKKRRGRNPRMRQLRLSWLHQTIAFLASCDVAWVLAGYEQVMLVRMVATIVAWLCVRSASSSQSVGE